MNLLKRVLVISLIFFSSSLFAMNDTFFNNCKTIYQHIFTRSEVIEVDANSAEFKLKNINDLYKQMNKEFANVLKGHERNIDAHRINEKIIKYLTIILKENDIPFKVLIKEKDYGDKTLKYSLIELRELSESNLLFNKTFRFLKVGELESLMINPLGTSRASAVGYFSPSVYSPMIYLNHKFIEEIVLKNSLSSTFKHELTHSIVSKNDHLGKVTKYSVAYSSRKKIPLHDRSIYTNYFSRDELLTWVKQAFHLMDYTKKQEFTIDESFEGILKNIENKLKGISHISVITNKLSKKSKNFYTKNIGKKVVVSEVEYQRNNVFSLKIDLGPFKKVRAYFVPQTNEEEEFIRNVSYLTIDGIKESVVLPKRYLEQLIEFDEAAIDTAVQVNVENKKLLNDFKLIKKYYKDFMAGIFSEAEFKYKISEFRKKVRTFSNIVN